MLACAGGHIKVAVMLFEKGAFIDSKDNGGSCCLHWAVDGMRFTAPLQSCCTARHLSEHE